MFSVDVDLDPTCDSGWFVFDLLCLCTTIFDLLPVLLKNSEEVRGAFNTPGSPSCPCANIW